MWILLRKQVGISMQNTALSSTERSDHCGATSSDHKSWRPLAVHEGGKVQSYTVWREQDARSYNTSGNVTLLMSYCWCHSGDVHCGVWMSLCGYHAIKVNLLNSLCSCLSEIITQLMSLSWCHFIDVTLLVSICWCHSINKKMYVWATIVINRPGVAGAVLKTAS